MDPQPKTVLCCSARTCCLVIGWLLLILAAKIFIFGITLFLNVNDDGTTESFQAQFTSVFLIFYGIGSAFMMAIFIWAVTKRNGKLLKTCWRFQLSALISFVAETGFSMATQDINPVDLIIDIINIIITLFIIWVSRIYAQELLEQGRRPVFLAPSPTD